MSLSKLRQAMVAYCTTPKGLPPEYQEVYRIQGKAGLSYIDTGVPFNDPQMKIVLDIYTPNLSGSGSAQIAGISWSTGRYVIDVVRNTYEIRFRVGTGDQRISSGRLQDGSYAVANHIEMGYENGDYYGSALDATKAPQSITFSGSVSGYPSTSNIYIGAQNPTNTGENPSAYDMSYLLYCGADSNTGREYHGVKIYSGAGVLLRDYAMCYRKADNKVGMYDKVERQFYSSAGTEEFTLR